MRTLNFTNAWIKQAWVTFVEVNSNCCMNRHLPAPDINCAPLFTQRNDNLYFAASSDFKPS